MNMAGISRGRVLAVAAFVAVIGGLVYVFLAGFGRTNPEDQYKAILGADFNASASPFREFVRADPVSAISTKGSATAVAIFDGPGLHESLTFTVFENDAGPRRANRVVRQRYQARDTFQDINTFPREFCVRLPQHHFDCFVTIDNLFLHSSVVPVPSEWRSQSFKTEFEPLYLLRTGYKGWSAYFRFGESPRR